MQSETGREWTRVREDEHESGMRQGREGSDEKSCGQKRVWGGEVKESEEEGMGKGSEGRGVKEGREGE